MRKYTDSWSEAARELGVLVIELPCVRAGGAEVYPDMLVPHFGTEKGTLVFTEMQPRPIVEDLQAEGYTCSIFSPPPQGYRASVGTLIEILSDWGWAGPIDQKPSWLLQ